VPFIGVCSGKLDVVKFLLGELIEICYDALFSSAVTRSGISKGFTEIVSYLLDYGTLMDAVDNNGCIRTA
jgi:hypothetical protein